MGEVRRDGGKEDELNEQRKSSYRTDESEIGVYEILELRRKS